MLTFRRDTGKSPPELPPEGTLASFMRVDSRSVAVTRLALALSACGGAASAENTVRAQKEYELAVGLLEEKNTPAAFEHLFKAIELDPNNPEPRQLLGNLYLFRGDLPKAEEELQRSKKLAEKNEKYGPPFVAELENSLGVVYVHQKRYDEAVAILREAASNIVNRTPYQRGETSGGPTTRKASIPMQFLRSHRLCACRIAFAWATTVSGRPS